MNPRKAAFLNILVSIVFAVAIIVSSYVLRDTDYSQTVMFLLIGLWWIPFTALTAAGSGTSIGCEFACLKRKVARLFRRHEGPS